MKCPYCGGGGAALGQGEFAGAYNAVRRCIPCGGKGWIDERSLTPKRSDGEKQNEGAAKNRAKGGGVWGVSDQSG